VAAPPTVSARATAASAASTSPATNPKQQQQQQPTPPPLPSAASGDRADDDGGSFTAAVAAASVGVDGGNNGGGHSGGGGNSGGGGGDDSGGWRSARHVWSDIQRAAERRQEEEAALLAARPRPALAARAAASARDAIERLRGSLASTTAVVRARPSIAVWSLLCALSLLAAGLWAVLATAAQAERRARDDAVSRAEQVVQNLLFRVQEGAVFPNAAVGMFVYQAAARGLDAAGAAAIAAAGGLVPALLRGGLVSSPVDSAAAMAPNTNFYDIASAIRATMPTADVIVSIVAAPACVVTSAEPLAPNEGAIGLNLLCDGRCAARWPRLYNGTRYSKDRRAETLLAIRRAPRQTLAGPYALTQGGWGAIARFP